MKRIILFLAACIILLLPVMVFYTIPVLKVSGEDELEKVLYLQQENDFSIRWTHSVENEEWEEFFKVEEGQIVLDSTRFKTFGAGVPSDTGEDTFIKDGWVYMTDIHQPIGMELVTRTGKTTDHRVIRGDEVQQMRASQSYRFTVEEANLLHAIGYYIATRMR